MANYLKVSGIKQYIKSKGNRCSSGYIEQLDKLIEKTIDKSIENSKAVTLKELPEQESI